MKKRISQAMIMVFAVTLLLDYTTDSNAENSDKLKLNNDVSLVSGSAALGSVALNDIEVLEIEDSDTVVVSHEGPICGYENVGICNVSDGNLNVRESPEDGKVLGKFPANAACDVIDEVDGWYLIVSGNVAGFVSGEYLLTGEEAHIKAEELATYMVRSTVGGLNVRVSPSTDCTVMAQMAEGEEVEFVEDLGEWIKVLVDDETGYVFSEYVEVALTLPHAMTLSEMRYGAGVSDVRAELCEYALQFVGNKYVWGGTSLTNGTDCSGFTMRVYEHYGVSIPRTSRTQAKVGTSISASEAQPGDLFFYSNGTTINHVAIYIGGGQIVHASNPRSGIKISNAFYRSPCKVVSILD
ncbi:MAG: C40 family peptidase [Pseudobutyrivibrio sp.]|nr:C40 family peptidase [Pseudobutyrivibrio sp.]